MRPPTALLRLAARALASQAQPSSRTFATSTSGGLKAAVPASAAALQQLWRAQSPLALHSLRQHQAAGAGGAQQWCRPARGYADQAGGKDAGDGKGSAADESGSDGEAPTVEQLTADLQEREKAVEELQTKVNDLADSFKRSLAEMENLRQRTARQVENAHKFAVEPIIKSLFDVADNLQRAAEAVPAGAVDGSEQLEAERAQRLLKSLLEGVRMTEGVLMQVFKKHGVEAFNPAGEKFDPNLHQAMFEVPDASKDPGVVAVVTKRGFRMHDRVVRAAEVGVYKAP